MPEKSKTQQKGLIIHLKYKTFTFVRQNEPLKDTVVKVLTYIKWNLLPY